MKEVRVDNAFAIGFFATIGATTATLPIIMLTALILPSTRKITVKQLVRFGNKKYWVTERFKIPEEQDAKKWLQKKMTTKGTGHTEARPRHTSPWTSR